MSHEHTVGRMTWRPNLSKGELLLVVALVLAFLRAWPPVARAEDGGSAGAASSVFESYRSDKQVAAFRTGLTGADTAATTLSDVNLATCGEFDLGAPAVPGAARKSITLTTYHSVAASTVSVTIYTAWKADPTAATYTGVKRQGPYTFTAPSAAVRSARYIAPTIFLDSTGANVAFFVVSTAPSSGSVDLYCGSQ